jgi:uncharacterized protein
MATGAKQNPTRGNGKICYLEIPALDINRSALFYQNVFNWSIRKDQQGNLSFDDSVGEVSGMWIVGRKPSTEPGVLISIMVSDLDATLRAVTDQGGSVIQSKENLNPSESTALFADPAGNVFCLYQSEG